MSDEQKELTKVERAAVRKWLSERWKGDSRCAVCHENNWIIGQHLVAPMTTTSKRGVTLGGILHPQIMVVCNNCGNTLYFNAALMKLVESRTETDARAKKEGDGSNGDE